MCFCVFTIGLLSMSGENDVERPQIGHSVTFLSLGIGCLPCLLEVNLKVVVAGSARLTDEHLPERGFPFIGLASTEYASGQVSHID